MHMNLKAHKMNLKPTPAKVVVAAVLTITAHFVVEALKTRRDRLYRYAAGESDYERTHPKPRKKCLKI